MGPGEATARGQLTVTPGIVVLARLDSRRVPRKMLADLAGKPLLVRVIERVRQAGPVILATSDRTTDDELEKTARELGIAVYRGSAADVLGRLIAAAEMGGFDPVIRISGDSPFVDPSLIRLMVDEHQKRKVDVTTNVMPRTFPPGNSVEVLSLAALRRVSELTSSTSDREHVTTYFYNNPQLFKIYNHTAPHQGYIGH